MNLDAAPIASRLASFAVDSPGTAIPSELRATAALHMLDAVGCGLAAVGLEAGLHATEVVLGQGGRPEASILGDKKRLPAAPAAFANGTRCHSLDFDDTHERGICHSSTVLAPTVLAVGEAIGANGSSVLDGFVFGSEVALRIAAATADGLYARGFHPTSVCGSFGAAAAASRLLGFDSNMTTQALGIVGSFASGLFEYLSDGSATKPMHAGWAAQAGIQAALLAGAGGSGPATVIEGRFGLMASHTGTTSGAGAICVGLGETWEAGDISIKPFPACHFAHASTWAAGELADENDLGADDIADILVRIPPPGMALVLEPLAAKAAPQTEYDAKFSLPFTVAHRLLRGELDLRSFSEERIHDGEILRLAARVHGEALPERGDWSRFAGGAVITTRDNATLERFLPHSPGSPRNPLDQAWIVSKFRSNAGLSLPDSQIDELADALSTLDHAPSVDRIGALIGLAHPSRPA